MKTFLEYIKEHADRQPERTAVIVGGEERHTLTYATLYHRMLNREPLPMPLLGDSWDGSFTLYTTGTTGKQKGVIISQRAVIANSENLINGHGYTPDTTLIIAGPMDHLGCWSKIFPTLMMGGTLYIIKDGWR